jgi:hypothetical protein
LKFVITLVHAPEQCFARREYREEYTQWFKHMKESAEKLGIKIHGAYSTLNEHTFYFVIESNDFKSVTTFLGPPMLTHNSAKISPVIDLKKPEEYELSYMKGE